MIELCEVIYKCPNDRYPVMMDDSVNDEHEDIIRNDLVEKDDEKSKRDINRDRKEICSTQRY